MVMDFFKHNLINKDCEMANIKKKNTYPHTDDYEKFVGYSL